MTICPKCQSECPEQAKYCPECSNPLQSKQQITKDVKITKLQSVWKAFVRFVFFIIKIVGKSVWWAVVKLVQLITKPIRKFIKTHPYRFGLLIELLVLLGIIAILISLAFSKLGEYAIPAVVIPACFLFFGLVIFYTDYSTPEGKEKHKKRMRKVKNWFDQNGEDSKIAVLVLFGILEFVLGIIILVKFIV